jgi:hypothetical protein
MNLPRRLYGKVQYPSKADDYCEADDPDARYLVGGEGRELLDAEAELTGLSEYLKRTAGRVRTPRREEKQVEKAEVEDKAVEPSETEDKDEPGPGLHIRRGRRG